MSKNNTYVVRDILKFVAQDDCEKGELPGTERMYNLNLSFSGDSVENVIEQLKEFFAVDSDALELNACDEPGRVDISVLENGDSEPLSKQELAQWRRAKIKAYAAIYTAYIEQVTPARIGVK